MNGEVECAKPVAVASMEGLGFTLHLPQWALLVACVAALLTTAAWWFAALMLVADWWVPQESPVVAGFLRFGGFWVSGLLSGLALAILLEREARPQQ
jgi:hypothetical protein